MLIGNLELTHVFFTSDFVYAKKQPTRMAVSKSSVLILPSLFCFEQLLPSV